MHCPFSKPHTPPSSLFSFHSVVNFSLQSTIMAPILLLLVLILSITCSSDATWCVCRSDVPDSALQKTLDYACGAGADCLPIHQKGACFDPDTVRSHCSYAANSFFQKSGQTTGSCDFSGTAAVTTTDPSYGTCSYPATASAAGTNTTITPSSSTTTTPPFSTTTPNNFTTGGVLGGGVGPSGIGFTTDGTANGGLLLLKTGTFGFYSLLLATLFSSAFLLVNGNDGLI